MSSEAGSAGGDAARNVVWRLGRVKSDRMDKSIAVRVEHKVMHPIYKKYVKRYSTLVAHDETNTAHVGDLVEVEFTRPISKRKRWRLRRVVEQAVLPDAASIEAGTVEAGMAQAGLTVGGRGGDRPTGTGPAGAAPADAGPTGGAP